MKIRRVDFDYNDYDDVTSECVPTLMSNGYIRLSHDGVDIISWGIGEHYTHVEGKRKGYLVIAVAKVVPDYYNFRVMKRKPMKYLVCRIYNII